MKLIGFIGCLCVFFDEEEEKYFVAGDEIYDDFQNEWELQDFIRENQKQFLKIEIFKINQ